MHKTFNFLTPIVSRIKQLSMLTWIIVLAMLVNFASCKSCRTTSSSPDKENQNKELELKKDSEKATMQINEKLLQGIKKEVEVTFKGVAATNLDQLYLVVKGDKNQNNDQIGYYEGIQLKSFPANTETKIPLKGLFLAGQLSQGNNTVKFTLEPHVNTASMNVVFELMYNNTDGTQKMLQNIPVRWEKQALKLQVSSAQQEFVGNEVLKIEIASQEKINTNEVEVMLVNSKEDVTWNVGNVKSIKNGNRFLLSTVLPSQALNRSDKLTIELQLNQPKNEKFAEVSLQFFDKAGGQLIGEMQPVNWLSKHVQLRIIPNPNVAMSNQQVEVQIENVGPELKTTDIEVTFQVLPATGLSAEDSSMFLVSIPSQNSRYIKQGNNTFTLYDLMGEEQMLGKSKKSIQISSLSKAKSNETVLTIGAINKADSNQEIGNSGPIKWRNIFLVFKSANQFSNELDVTVTNQGGEVELADIEVAMQLNGDAVGGTKFDLGGALKVSDRGKVTLDQILKSPKLSANQSQTFKIKLAEANITASADLFLTATIKNSKEVIGFLNTVHWQGIMLAASVQNTKLYGNKPTTITLTNTGSDLVNTQELTVELVHPLPGVEYKLGKVENITDYQGKRLFDICAQEFIQPNQSVKFDMAVTDNKNQGGPIDFTLGIRNEDHRVIIEKSNFVIWQKTGVEISTNSTLISGNEPATITLANAGDQAVDISGIRVLLEVDVTGINRVTFQVGRSEFDFNPLNGINTGSKYLTEVLGSTSNQILPGNSTSFQLKCTEFGSTNSSKVTIRFIYSSNDSVIKEIPLNWQRQKQ